MHKVAPVYLNFLMHRHSRCLKLPKGQSWLRQQVFLVPVARKGSGRRDSCEYSHYND